jgi:hypothetical protein
MRGHGRTCVPRIGSEPSFSAAFLGPVAGSSLPARAARRGSNRPDRAIAVRRSASAHLGLGNPVPYGPRARESDGGAAGTVLAARGWYGWRAPARTATPGWTSRWSSASRPPRSAGPDRRQGGRMQFPARRAARRTGPRGWAPARAARAVLAAEKTHRAVGGRYPPIFLAKSSGINGLDIIHCGLPTLLPTLSSSLEPQLRSDISATWRMRRSHAGPGAAPGRRGLTGGALLGLRGRGVSPSFVSRRDRKGAGWASGRGSCGATAARSAVTLGRAGAQGGGSGSHMPLTRRANRYCRVAGSLQ